MSTQRQSSETEELRKQLEAARSEIEGLRKQVQEKTEQPETAQKSGTEQRRQLPESAKEVEQRHQEIIDVDPEWSEKLKEESILEFHKPTEWVKK